LRAPAYSLRTGILAYLAFLILAAMLLINVVTVKFAERDLIQAKIKLGRLALKAAEQKAENLLTLGKERSKHFGPDSNFTKEVHALLQEAGFSEALMVDREGGEVFRTGPWDGGYKPALSMARETLATRQGSYRFYGSIWGVVWLAHENVKVSAAIFSQDRLVGSMTICAHLEPNYESLRHSERITLLYILSSTILLVFFGMYLLSRLVIKPIHHLLRITDTFKEGESLPVLSDADRNEIGQLYHSLDMMLTRLEENKRELKAHVSSLEEANLELQRAQAEILRSEKLASVGRLATGVAHEIGNPIGIILGYLELLKRKDLSPGEIEDFLERIESEVGRINHIIRQLLDFSRTSGRDERPVHVHDLIMETVDIMNPQPMMAHVEVRCSFKALDDTVWADPNRLQQVFLNIIMNAADAMEEGRLSKTGALQGLLTITSDSGSEMVEIRFTDTGPGIPGEAIGRIFDPFYTTKEPGKGTGLGLSVCYRIIEELGGKIHAESPPGEGTTVVISIPSYSSEMTGTGTQEERI
jgi:two-component system NtrC family sensor kinase